MIHRTDSNFSRLKGKRERLPRFFLEEIIRSIHELHEDQHVNCTGEINFLLPRYPCQILISVSLFEGFVIISSRSFPLISHLPPFSLSLILFSVTDSSRSLVATLSSRDNRFARNGTRILMPCNWVEEGTSIFFLNLRTE